MNRHCFLQLVLLGLVLPVVGLAQGPSTRPANWATPLNRPGLPNLHKVSDTLYRGAQPTARGMKELEALGIKTVVNLRSEHSDQEILGDAKLSLERLQLRPWSVTEDDVIAFLQIATNPERQPVFVHCMHGADRTGVMCAAYRVAVEGWTKQAAIDEMTGGGFGFHSIWMNLPQVIENLDVQRVKTKLNAK